MGVPDFSALSLKTFNDLQFEAVSIYLNDENMHRQAFFGAIREVGKERSHDRVGGLYQIAVVNMSSRGGFLEEWKG